jgi:3-deoxy-D-manno-octulosonate 8-phosphate phosphatase (KDO 8-P phosphatase)
MASDIKHIVFDLDGVLTDGKQYITIYGNKKHKAVNARDKLGIKRLLAAGYTVTILTLDDWPGAKAWFERIGCNFVSIENKALYHVKPGTLGVGDDRDDMEWLIKCDIALTVNDGDPFLQRQMKSLLVNGGCGVVNYIENYLYDTHNRASSEE